MSQNHIWCKWIHHTGMFNEMSINQVTLPNSECLMIRSITNCLKNTFRLPKLTKIPFKAWRFPFFQPLFVPMNYVFDDKRGMKWNTICWGPTNTMLRHQAAENSLTTSSAPKKELFSSRDDCSSWIFIQFKRTSYFLGFQAWVLWQNEKQKKYAQNRGQRSTFSILVLLFFIISQNECLNFFKTAFELLL